MSADETATTVEPDGATRAAGANRAPVHDGGYR
jgi:hypothetical protein